MEKIYTTIKSKGILSIYWFSLIFVLFMMLGTPYLANEGMSGNDQNVFYIVFVIIFIWLCYIIYRINKIRYVINNNEITIHGAFNKNIIKINEIEEVRRSPIPFGIRLFGGSFIGGRYYFPGIGKAWVVMTNFKDGVLIKTHAEENYVITPKDPDEFIKDIRNNN